MDKYEEAIEFLKAVEPSSYFDECAAIIEELLFRIYELENKPKRVRRDKTLKTWKNSYIYGKRK
jgi:hypothetical protein